MSRQPLRRGEGRIARNKLVAASGEKGRAGAAARVRKENKNKIKDKEGSRPEKESGEEEETCKRFLCHYLPRLFMRVKQRNYNKF